MPGTFLRALYMLTPLFITTTQWIRSIIILVLQKIETHRREALAEVTLPVRGRGVIQNQWSGSLLGRNSEMIWCNPLILKMKKRRREMGKLFVQGRDLQEAELTSVLRHLSACRGSFPQCCPCYLLLLDYSHPSPGLHSSYSAIFLIAAWARELPKLPWLHEQMLVLRSLWARGLGWSCGLLLDRFLTWCTSGVSTKHL